MTPESALRPILLIDDDNAHRLLIKRALHRFAISNPLIELSGIADARSTLFRENPTAATIPVLIILDLHLHDGRGTVLLDEIRASAALREVRVLVLSTSALESDIEESYQKGASRFLTKASDPGEFANRVVSSVKELLEGEPS